jgi:hypothetical protein
MEELGTPPKLMDERMGHEDGSVQSRYTHVTASMRLQLLDGLTEHWNAALDARRTLHAASPVLALNQLLVGAPATVVDGSDRFSAVSPITKPIEGQLGRRIETTRGSRPTWRRP